MVKGIFAVLVVLAHGLGMAPRAEGGILSGCVTRFDHRFSNKKLSIRIAIRGRWIDIHPKEVKYNTRAWLTFEEAAEMEPVLRTLRVAQAAKLKVLLQYTNRLRKNAV